MTSLFRRIVAGAVGGAVGTLAMDLVWYRRYRQDGGDAAFPEWEFSSGTDSFEDASAPGKVGKRLADAVGIDLPAHLAGATTNVMHWATGIGYGVGHGLLQHRRGTLSGGGMTGVGAFANSYATLGALGIYEPIWDYDLETIWDDLSAHLVFGLVTAVTYRALTDGS